MTTTSVPTSAAPGTTSAAHSPAAGGAGAVDRLDVHRIGGRVVAAGGEREVVRVSPVDGRPAVVLVPAGEDEVAAAVAGASAARRTWRRTAPGERAAALRAAAQRLRERADELGALLTQDTGRLLAQAVESAQVAAGILDEAATVGLGATGRTLAGDALAMDVVRREPHGVVAVITPWNDPFPAAAGLIAAALVCGNTVVHKPSERSPRAGWELARTIAEALPPGVMEVLNGDGATGAAIVADPRVALVAQVGSSATGRAIARSAGERGARVLLENGGKDPLVVDTGVDPRWAAQQIATGAFTNTGQLCTSVERVYVHQDVADAVLDALVEIARDLRVGAPDDPATGMGPLVDTAQRDVVVRHVDEAVAAGARLLTGGTVPQGPGAYYPPTVLDGCTADMAVMTEETFGPVVAVTRVPDFATALELADTGAYGLAATVLTPRLDHALLAAEQLEVGTVKVNAVFGGAPGGSADPRRASGAGAGYGPDLLAAMTVLKAVHVETAVTT